MTRRIRWLCVSLVFALVVGLACAAAAADGTKVDQATWPVEQGAKQIGRGDVGPGFKEMFTGIGHTVVEGRQVQRRQDRGILQEEDIRRWS